MNVIWLDLETTGLDPEKCGIIQIGMQIVVSGVVKATAQFLMNPVGKEIDSEALQVNGRIEKELAGFPLPDTTARELTNLWHPFVSEEKLVLAGYNIDRFDIPFLNVFLEENLVVFSGYFSEQTIDLYRDLDVYEQAGFLSVPNRKLVTIAKSLGVNTEGAHDALEDVRIVRESAIILQKRYIAKKGVEDWRQRILGKTGEING